MECHGLTWNTMGNSVEQRGIAQNSMEQHRIVLNTMEDHGIAWDSMVWDNMEYTMEYNGITWNILKQLDALATKKLGKRLCEPKWPQMANAGIGGASVKRVSMLFHAIPRYSRLFHAALGPSFHMVFCGVRFGPWIIPQQGVQKRSLVHPSNLVKRTRLIKLLSMSSWVDFPQ